MVHFTESDVEAAAIEWLQQVGYTYVGGPDIAPREQLQVASMEDKVVPAEKPTRREWWSVFAWGALVLLIGEWLVQYRGGITWVWGRISSKIHRAR